MIIDILTDKSNPLTIEAANLLKVEIIQKLCPFEKDINRVKVFLSEQNDEQLCKLEINARGGQLLTIRSQTPEAKHSLAKALNKSLGRLGKFFAPVY